MALVPFPGAAAPDPDDDRHIHLTDADPFEEEGTAKMSFLDHLDELRKRLIWAVTALIACCLISFLFVDRIQAFIMVPLARYMPPGEGFIFTDGFEPFMLWMKIGALGGLMLASPLIIWQLWLFIAPGLYSHEKRFAIPFVLFSTIFFVIGAAFSHYIAFPWTWQFFLSWETPYMKFMPSIGPAFSTYVKMLLAFGLIFQLPTLVFFLARMGVVTAGMLIRNTKYAVLIIFILGAVLSPGTDVVSQAMMAGPMLVLYALSIGVAWVFAKRKNPA
jgi:sec-independent protein translocase protein TatC